LGFSTELLFLLMLGLVVLGPKRLRAVLGHVARAKAAYEKATRGIQSQLGSQPEVAPHDHEYDVGALSIRAAHGTEPNQPDSLAARTG
jgi:Sec-independent protein translocase protein TatA